MTLRTYFQQMTDLLLPSFGPDESKSLVLNLFQHQLNIKKTDLVLNPSWEINPKDAGKIKEYCNEILKGRPIQYVLGYAWFMDLRFEVNPSVLIPRPETEELVDRVLRYKHPAAYTVLEAGTGSGCIAVSIKHRRPRWDVHAMDASVAALETARKNSQAIEADVSFYTASIDGERMGLANDIQPDLVISNPPYVPESERQSLPENVRSHEPAEALYTPNNDPLYYYRHIAKQSSKMLKPEGRIALECHEDYANDVKTLFRLSGFADSDVINDLNGKKRFVFASLQ